MAYNCRIQRFQSTIFNEHQVNSYLAALVADAKQQEMFMLGFRRISSLKYISNQSILSTVSIR